MEGVSSQWLLQHMKGKDKKCMSKAELLAELSVNPRALLLTMGAGDIDQLIEPIEKILNSNKK